MKREKITQDIEFQDIGAQNDFSDIDKNMEIKFEWQNKRKHFSN